MTANAPSIPDDLAACQAMIERQQATIDQLQEQLDQLRSTTGEQSETIDSQQQLIDKLRHELELFKRYIFGRRRERFVDAPGQKKLFDVDPPPAEEGASADEEDEHGDPKPRSPKRRRGHGRRPLPEFLPRQDKIHELNEEERKCPCCGKLRIKVSEEVSEQLEFQPASLFVVRHVRFIYACQEDECEANMVTAPKPPQPIEKGLPGPGLLAFVASSKLADHLPLNRLEDILTRYGVHLARSTLCDWMAACAKLTRPLYELIVCLALESKVLGTDDTKVNVLDRNLDHTRTAYFWAYVGDLEHPYICYDFTTHHSRDGPEKFLQGFQGYLQGDAYSGYIEIARESHGVIRHAGCWAHARRYYDRARTSAPTVAVHEALAYIRRLYDVEDEAASLSSEQRLRLRQEKSVAILSEFHRWLGEQQPQILPQSPLGEAITYTLNQWESLCLFTQDGDVPIDNNRTEHALRQQVLGRVNWLFVGSDQGGETAAVLYTLVASCKRLRIDPFAYLRDVFTRLPEISTDDELRELLPDRWIEKHPEHRLAHREKEADQAKQRRRQRRARRRKLQNAK
jgi:transposase